MRTMSTRTTLEFRLALAVGFLAMSTLGTSPAGIPGIDRDHGDTSQCGLVLDKRPQLEKGPTRESITLFSASSRDSVADAFEIFEADSPSGALGGLHDLLGDAMILVTTEPGFLCLGPFRSPANVLGPLACSPFGTRGFAQRLATLAVMTASGIDFLAGELVSVLGHGDVYHAEVNTHEVCRGNWRSFRNINRDEQKPFSIVAKYQVGLPLGVSKLFSLVLAHHEGDQFPTGERQQTHSVGSLETHGPLVIDDCGMLAELGLDALVPLVRVANGLDRKLSHLGGQPESFPNFLVGELADAELVGLVASKAFGGDPAASLVEPFDDRAERPGLFGIGQELDLDREFHNPRIVESAQTIKSGLKPSGRRSSAHPFGGPVARVPRAKALKLLSAPGWQAGRAKGHRFRSHIISRRRRSG
jgi:hypothetical protein